MLSNVYFKLEKGPTDKAKEPDPGGSDQPYGWIELFGNTIVQSNRTVSFSVFKFSVMLQRGVLQHQNEGARRKF